MVLLQQQLRKKVPDREGERPCKDCQVQVRILQKDSSEYGNSVHGK